MYYSHKCSYCSKIFYVYHDTKEQAAEVLYHGIKKHLVEHGEDHKEYEFDEDPKKEIDQMYYAVTETTEEPTGGYELK